jgi:hypothetical protein
MKLDGFTGVPDDFMLKGKRTFLETGAMTEQRLSWEEISKQYNQQWVELVDYEWPEGSPFPQVGVVRVHEADRKKFHALVQKQSPSGSALLFVGVPEKNETTVYNNLCRVQACS